MANKYLIALDDGHGMNTPGKRTPPLTKDLYIDGKLVRKKGEVIKENEFNMNELSSTINYIKSRGYNIVSITELLS